MNVFSLTRVIVVRGERGLPLSFEVSSAHCNNKDGRLCKLCNAMPRNIFVIPRNLAQIRENFLFLV